MEIPNITSSKIVTFFCYTKSRNRPNLILEEYQSMSVLLGAIITLIIILPSSAVFNVEQRHHTENNQTFTLPLFLLNRKLCADARVSTKK